MSKRHPSHSKGPRKSNADGSRRDEEDAEAPARRSHSMATRARPVVQEPSPPPEDPQRARSQSERRSPRPQSSTSTSDVTDCLLGSQHRDSKRLNRRKLSRDRAGKPRDDVEEVEPSQPNRRSSSVVRVAAGKVVQMFPRSESKEKMKKSKAKRNDDEQFDTLPDEFFNEKRRGGHRKDDKDGPGGSSGFGFLRNRAR